MDQATRSIEIVRALSEGKLTRDTSSTITSAQSATFQGEAIRCAVHGPTGVRVHYSDKWLKVRKAMEYAASQRGQTLAEYRSERNRKDYQRRKRVSFSVIGGHGAASVNLTH